MPKRNDPIHESSEDDSGKAGTGGKSGQVEFKEFLGNSDRILSDAEKKHLLGIHQDTHATCVKKQKERRDQYHQLKNGQVKLQTYRQGLSGASAHSQYKAHPTLKDKAQFSGMDNKVNNLPTENIANTNDEKRNELDLQYQLRHKPEAPRNAPKFNPKPQFR